MKKSTGLTRVRQGLILGSLLMGGSALAGAAGSGTWNITSTGAQTVSGNYTTPQGSTGTFTLTRTAYSGYTNTVNFQGGGSGLQALNNSVMSPGGGDAFTYNLSVTPSNSAMAANTVLEVVQAPYATSGNSEVATMQLNYSAGAASVVANPAVDMFTNADGLQIRSQGTPAPQLRQYSTAYPKLVYSDGTINPTYPVLSASDYPALAVGAAIPSGTTIQQFGAANVDSGYKIKVANSTALTLNYTGNMQGSSALREGTTVGETVNEWIGFGIRGVNTDLQMSKTVNQTTAYNNGQVTYTLTVTNSGTEAVTGATLQDAAVTGIAKQTVSCVAGTACTTAPTLTQLQGGFALPLINPGETYQIQVTATVTGTLNQQRTNTAKVTMPTGTTDSNTANNTASATVTIIQPPPIDCSTTMAGLFYTGTDLYGYPKYQTIAPVNRSTNPYSRGTTISTVTNNSAGYDYNTALAVSPDGTKYYVPTPVDGLKIYDVSTNTWSTVAYPSNYVKSDTSNPTRAAVAPDGTLYFSYDNLLWSYSPSSGTVSNALTLTFNNTSGLSPAPTLLSSGDFIAAADGSLYLISNENQASLDVFKIDPKTGVVTFMGRVTGASIDGTVKYNGIAALSDGIYVSASNSQYLKIDLTTMTATQVSPSASTNTMKSYDLTSCYYPNLQPQISAVKSVAKVAGSAGSDVTVGDTLEYTIVVRNSGTINAGNITLQDAIPAGTTYVAGSTTLNTGAVADVGGTMPFVNARAINSPGAGSGVLEVDTTSGTTTSSVTDPDDNEAVVKFRVTVNSGTSEVRNKATIVHVAGTTTTNETVTSTGAPALTVVKSVDTSFVTVTPDTGNTGTAPLPASQLSPAQIKYTITVTNTGTAPASAVNVTDTLPAGLTYVSATLAKSTATNTYGTPVTLTNNGSGQNLSFNIGDLTAVEPGKSAQIVVTASVNLAANTNQTALLNTAAATATGVTQTTSNQVRTDVIYPKLTKRVRNVTQNTAFGTTSGGYPGDILEYCLDYRNYSSTALNNWKIEDTIPANTSFYAISTPMDGLIFDGSKVIYGPLTLAAGTSGSVCFQVLIGERVRE